MPATHSTRIRLLIVDDQEIVRVGLVTLLKRYPQIEVVGETATEAEAISAAKLLDPDVVLMDVRLPHGSGVSACRQIRAKNPRIKVLFLTAFDDDEALLATVFASADGYLLKEIGTDHLVDAIEMVASGLSVIDFTIARPVMDRLRTLAAAAYHDTDGEQLSAQERCVLELVAGGKTNKEIAAEMGLSPKTVKNYLSRIFQKLQVTRRSEAVARLIRGRSS
jgi:two-component system, NarL family, response regulator DevR